VKQQIKQFSNKILIYEEEPSVRNKIIHTLTAKGYFPEKVETVTDILLILKNDIPCLLILDLSGSEILSFLEKNEDGTMKKCGKCGCKLPMVAFSLQKTCSVGGDAWKEIKK